MLLGISEYLTYYFLKNKIIDKDKTDIFIYGFQLLLSTISSIVSILILSSFINILYGIVFLLFFMPIRFCAGGYHANTYNKCFIYTNSCFVITLLYSKIMPQYLLYIHILIVLVGWLYLWSKAPCKNVNNPLNEEALNKNKFHSHIILIIYAISIVITYYSQIFIFSLELNTVFLVSILFLVGNLENK